MKLTLKMKLAGERAMQDLSPEAYAMYTSLDPLEVYETDDGIFSLRGVEDRDDMTLQDIEDLMMTYQEEPANDENSAEEQTVIWETKVRSIRDCAITHAIPYTTMITATKKDIDKMSVRVFHALADYTGESMDDLYIEVKYRKAGR